MLKSIAFRWPWAIVLVVLLVIAPLSIGVSRDHQAFADPASPVYVDHTLVTTSGNSVGTASFSHTVPFGSNRLLLVAVMLRGEKSVSSITYGEDLLQVTSQASGAPSGTSVELWYLLAPPIGTADVVVTFTNSVLYYGIAAVNFTGVDQTTPFGAIAGDNQPSGTNITTDITTLNADALIFGAATARGGDTDPFTPGGGITERWDTDTAGTGGDNADAGLWGGERVAPTPDSYIFSTISSASDAWAIAAVEINAGPPDTTTPTVTIDQADGQDDPTDTSPIDFTVVFSEEVAGFIGADVTLSGTAGVTTAIVTGGPSIYNVRVSGMTGDGTVIASIGEGVAFDAAGNGNEASTSTDNEVTFDTGAPDTTITDNPPVPDNDTTPTFEFTSTEEGSSFECQIDGGGFSVCSSPETVGPLVEGNHTFEVRATDAIGNTDATPASYSWFIDLTAPTVTIDQADGQDDPTDASPIDFTVVFSEGVTDFTDGDVSLSGTAGATMATVTGGPSIYNVAVTGITNDGTVIASVGEGVAFDGAGNGNDASTSTDNQVTFETPPPPPPPPPPPSPSPSPSSPPPSEADLSVTKVADASLVAEGDSLVYTITVTNNGPSFTTGVTVTDVMPSGVIFVSATTSQGSFDSSTGEWDLSNVAPGDSETLEITVMVDVGTSGTTIVNNVQVTAVGPNDPVSDNDSATAEITISRKPTLTVPKIVINDDGGTGKVDDFTLRIDGSVVGSGTANTLSVGNYTVTEDDPGAGYTVSFGGDCAPDGTVALDLGENKVCTVTNDDIAPTLTATKVVINDDSGTAEVGDFTLRIDGEVVVSGSVNTVSAGTHTVSEDASGAGYAVSFGGGCAPDGTVTLNPGDNKVCTVTNDDIELEPTVTNPGVQSGTEGDAVSLQIVANDSASDTLTYSATGLPNGLSIDSSTGLISGTISSTASQGSPYSVEIEVSDGDLSSTVTFTWTVAGAIEPTPVPPEPTPTSQPEPTATPVPPTPEPAAFPVEGEIPGPGDGLSWWIWLLIGLGTVALITGVGRRFLPWFPILWRRRGQASE